MVSRETSLSRGLEALGVPGAGDAVVLDRLRRLRVLLEDMALPRGYLGPAEADRLVSRHILESAAIAEHLAEPTGIVDVGSGAGLPGLVLACILPGPVTLIEAQARRAAFLRLAARELGLTVEIHHARAEDAGHGPLRESAGAATARALATLPVGLELTLPFVALGGRAVLMSGDPGRDASLGPPVTLAAAAAALGGGPPRWSQFEVPGAKERRWVMIVQKIGSTPQRFPRHAGAIRRRPLDDGVA